MKSALIEVGRTYGGGPNAEKRTIKSIADWGFGYGDVASVQFTVPSDPIPRRCSIGRFIAWAKTVEIDGVTYDRWGNPVEAVPA